MPAGDRYVEVPKEAMLSFLTARGFKDAPEHSRREIVYERSHHVDPRFRVLVYTSIARGDADARGLGKDAIRVVPIFINGNHRSPIAKKLQRVFRTGSVEKVLARTLERMREAYGIINNRPEVRAILARPRAAGSGGG